MPVCGRRRRSRLRQCLTLLTVGLPLGCLLYGERLCYTGAWGDRLNTGTTYPRFAANRTLAAEAVRLLLVADPQLIGYDNEPAARGPLARWDSDRYLRNSFAHVFHAVRPQLVVFMGDLFDEGSTAGDGQFAWTHQRFRSVYAPLYASEAQCVHVHGDNDAGGEGGEPFDQATYDRFKRHFADRFDPAAIGLGRFHFVQGDIFNGTYWDVAGGKGDGEQKTKVLISHGPLLKGYYYSGRDILKKVAPRLILSAHDHTALITRAADALDRLTWRDYSLRPHTASDYSFDLPAVGGGLWELRSPTCSYRMGVPNMGFGLLYIEESGDGSGHRVHFGVVWLPSRFAVLIAYAVCAALAAVSACALMLASRCPYSIVGRRSRLLLC